MYKERFMFKEMPQIEIVQQKVIKTNLFQDDVYDHF
jgi:hypothetical protein